MEEKEQTVDTSINMSTNDIFEELITESNRLKALIDSAKTKLKKQYYEKKLDKVRQKAYKVMLAKVMENPSLLKKVEDEQVQ